MFRPHLALALLFVSALSLLGGCASLPEGSQKPKLELTSITLQRQDGMAGFQVDGTLTHHSMHALPLKAVRADIFVNGSKAAHFFRRNDKPELIAPGETYKLSYFVPANLATRTAVHSLYYNNLLQVQTSGVLTLIFDEEDNNTSFNPSATFEGLSGHNVSKREPELLSSQGTRPAGQ